MNNSDAYPARISFSDPAGRATLYKALEQSPSAISLVNRDGLFVYVNRRFSEITGYKPEDVLGKHTRLMKSGEMDADQYRKLWKTVLSGKEWFGEFHNRKKNGECYWEQASISPILNEQGDIEYFVKISLDCTRERELEDDLRNSLQRMRDVTDQLHEEQKRYERLVRATNGFVHSVDLEGGAACNVIYYPGCEQVTGYTAEEYARDPSLWRDKIHPDDAEAERKQVDELRAGAPVVLVEHRIFHRDGSLRWLKNTSVPRRDDKGRLIGYDGLITDITELKRAEADRDALTGELRDMAVRDSLTGLTNRRGFEDELNRVWAFSLRHRFPLGLLVIDIDHFKTLNDAYGHIVGDQVLVESATLIRSSVRDSDVVCRFGGDEMIVILPRSEHAETRKAAERILQAFRAHTFCRGMHDLRVLISIGAVTGTALPDDTADRFLSRADKALYRAKHSGRDQVCDVEKDLTPGDTPPYAGMPTTPEKGDLPGMVMVIDDDPSVCALVQRILMHDGFGVTTTGSVADAVAELQSERGRFDVVLVDLNLGDESGLDLLKQLKKIDATVIPIVITGEVSAENAICSLRYGAYDLLRKPLSRAPLVALIQRAVEYRRLLLENRRYQMRLEDMVREKSSALSNALGKLRESFQFTLEIMATMLDAREKKTGAHSKRVATMATVLAQEMGVSGQDARAIEVGALLHDIGKIAVPDSILLKPGPLNEEERAVMRRHPQLGYDMIRENPGLTDAAEIVLSHQEHHDGNGYPRGLKGEEICLGARIFAVVDAYDAMRDERAYSKPLSPREACEEIWAHCGTQFDPAVVDAFRRCLAEVEAARTQTPHSLNLP